MNVDARVYGLVSDADRFFQGTRLPEIGAAQAR